MTNPPVFYDSSTPPTAVVLELDEARVETVSEDEFFLQRDFDNPTCDLLPEPRLDNTFNVVGLYKGQYYLFEPQMKLLSNDMNDPLPDGGGSIVELTRLTMSEESDKSNQGHEALCRYVFGVALLTSQCRY